MTKKEFPLFPLRLSHKGKNKGKYISFHYLMGWKACKTRKVQEISPQIPIDGVEYELHEGESIVMPAKHPHAVYGKEQFKMLLVVVF